MPATPQPLVPADIAPNSVRCRLQICKECFYQALENEVHRTIVDNDLFKPGEVVAMGASGGKDSTVLIHILSTLNARHRCV